MTRKLINPHLLRASYLRVSNKADGSHTYRSAFATHGRTVVSRRVHRTASRAREYADRVLLRWKRLYDAIRNAEPT